MPDVDARSDTLIAGVPSIAEIEALPANLHVLAGRYELIALIGVGGMGAVYRARDRELGEIVALKVLRRELAQFPGMIERFRQEVKLARRVTHANVARTFDIGEHEGDRFLTMELVEGESLATLLERTGPLPVHHALAIAEAVANGLAAAHIAGVVHRDLKPENVLLAADGAIKVTDFGIATARAGTNDSRVTGEAVGTPAYMAPEQVTADSDIDARADVFAFGVMLFEMLTGALPWTGPTSLAIASARLIHPPRDPRTLRDDLAPDLVAALLGLIARSREARPADASAVVVALASLRPAPHTRPSTRPPPLGDPRAALRTLAVLPLANDGAPEEDYVAAGLTDELIDELSLSSALRVQSRGATLAFRGTTEDPQTIGRRLGVQVLVSGAVRRSGDDVRVTLRLVSVEDGFQLWSARTTTTFAEVLPLVARAAKAIAETVAVDHAPARRAALDDPKTFEIYLRARHAVHVFSPDAMATARALFEDALARSPDDPMVLAGYASALLRSASFGGSSLVLAAARRAAERAASIRPDLCEAQLALAAISNHACDLNAAARHARHALETAPSNLEARALIGRMLVDAGCLDDGLRHLRVVLDMDPRHGFARTDVTRVYALLGDWDRARATYFEGSDEDRPWPFWMNGFRFFGVWGDDEAMEMLVASFHASRFRDDAITATLLTAIVNGDPEPHLASITTLLGTDANTAHNRAFAAQIGAEFLERAGRDEEAIAAIARSVELGLGDRIWLDRCEAIARARRDPRFAALRETVAKRAEEVARILT